MDAFFLVRQEIRDPTSRRDWADERGSFTLDGNLIETCASLKRFRPKGEDPWGVKIREIRETTQWIFSARNAAPSRLARNDRIIASDSSPAHAPVSRQFLCTGLPFSVKFPPVAPSSPAPPCYRAALSVLAASKHGVCHLCVVWCAADTPMHTLTPQQVLTRYLVGITCRF